jgi:hypothetical protein
MKRILKSSDGLIQLRQCPKCRYMVREADVVWERQPNDISDDGEIKYCRFCDPDEVERVRRKEIYEALADLVARLQSGERPSVHTYSELIDEAVSLLKAEREHVKL